MAECKKQHPILREVYCQRAGGHEGEHFYSDHMGTVRWTDEMDRLKQKRGSDGR